MKKEDYFVGGCIYDMEMLGVKQKMIARIQEDGSVKFEIPTAEEIKKRTKRIRRV